MHFTRNALHSTPKGVSLPPSTLDLSIITINYKSVDYLKTCIQSIHCNLKSTDYEVIVIDNDSQDGSAEIIKNEFPQHRLIANKENLGFTKAGNQGIKLSRGRFILLLNNDTAILPGAIEGMLKIMEDSPQIGLLGCQLLNTDKTIQQSFGKMAGMINDFGRKFILNNLYARYSHPIIKPILDWAHSEEKEVDWVCGACMLIRREALEEVGLMDEEFFMYWEDVDLGVCLRQLGWEVCFTPSASIIHHSGSSSTKNKYQTAYEYRRSQLYFYKKHYGKFGLWRLKIYLYLKMNYAILKHCFQRLFSKKSLEDLEQINHFNRRVYNLIREYR